MRRLLPVLAATLLVACGSSNHLHHGRVLSKHYEPADSYITTQCIVYGKYGCTASIPINHYEPEEYRLLISECTEHEHDGCRHETHLTDRDTFAHMEPGSLWNDGSGQ